MLDNLPASANDDAPNPRAVIGGNQPPADAVIETAPELSPFEIAEKAVLDAYDETVLWLDGAVIDSQELADGVANLLTMIRAAEKLADDARKAEKASLDEQIAEIQTRYAPLIGNTKSVRGKTVLAAASCKAALQPWLDAEDKRLREEAAAKREAAERAAAEAAAALQAATAKAPAAGENLAEREAAEALYATAQRAQTAANVASRATAKAGSIGRSASLRTVYDATMTDAVAAARHYWQTRPDDVAAFVQSLADADVRAGLRVIPGFAIAARKVAI